MEYIARIKHDRFFVDTIEVAEWVQEKADKVRSRGGPCSEGDANDLDDIADKLRNASTRDNIEDALSHYRHMDTSPREELLGDDCVAARAFTHLLNHFQVS